MANRCRQGWLGLPGRSPCGKGIRRHTGASHVGLNGLNALHVTPTRSVLVLGRAAGAASGRRVGRRVGMQMNIAPTIAP